MTDSFAKRRRAEHARRRREEAERIREIGGDPSDLAREIAEARGSSQLTTLPGETWEDIFAVPEQATTGEVTTTEDAGRGVEAPGACSVEDRSLPTRTPEEQEKLVRAFKRAFRAKEISADSGTATLPELTTDEAEACALCGRTKSRRVLGRDGRKWCTGSDEDSCLRIAQNRLGASGSAQGSSRALTGKLRPDGDCRRCGAPIKWVKTQKGKNMPVDVDPAPAKVDAFELVGAVNTLAFFISEKKRETFAGTVYRSHFQTCEANDGT